MQWEVRLFLKQQKTAEVTISPLLFGTNDGLLTKQDFEEGWKKANEAGIRRIHCLKTTIEIETAQAIAKCISSGEMKCFGFANCDIEANGMKIILKACCEPSAQLEEIMIIGDRLDHQYHGNPLVEDGEGGLIVDLLKKSTTLKLLFIIGTALTDDSAKAIADGIKGNSSLVRFIFQTNNVTEKGLEALRDAAKNKGLDVTSITK
ncbi:MAG: hypothetical protein K6C34_02600 [Alphaproteobacteria bacterium]|nr:hypothetical protein [Alphaproteobacteria bacterium]